MEAQQKIASPIGEYSLRGVMETACGFKLNEDSTFQFFFSYGALDRFGEGRWRVEGDWIVFNSKPKQQDFTLVASGADSANSITIRIKEANEMLLRHVFCKITGGGKEQEAMTDEKGFIRFATQPLDTIEIIFEFCPEKKSVFSITNPEHHSFEFKPEPVAAGGILSKLPLKTNSGRACRRPSFFQPHILPL